MTLNICDFYLKYDESKRYDESVLNAEELKYLYNVIKNGSVDLIESLVKKYNTDRDNMSRVDKIYLLNYVCKKESKYDLYYMNGKRMVMEHNNKFKIEKPTILETATDKINKCLKIIKEDLKYNGFKILIDGNEILAFNKERNIVYYIPNTDDFDSSKEYYLQPVCSIDGITTIVRHKTLEGCNEGCCEFPIFDEYNFLNIYSYSSDGSENEYKTSMKKIKKHNELYNSVGDENRKNIDAIVNATIIKRIINNQ